MLILNNICADSKEDLLEELSRLSQEIENIPSNDFNSEGTVFLQRGVLMEVQE